MMKLHTTFKQKSSLLCNIELFDSCRIGYMHETMKRLYESARSLKGIEGQSNLARFLNETPQTVKNWENRGVSKQGMIKAEQMIGGSVSYIKDGVLFSDVGASRTALDNNVSIGPDLRGQVPLISTVPAGDFKEAIDNLHPGDYERMIDVSVPVGRHTFALRVSGDSMEPEFRDGDVIVVEPDIQAEHGDFVVAKNGGDATFKQLWKDGVDWYLKPLNNRYPIKLLGDSAIIGVVREKTKRYK